jgi:hypothetical protein
MLRRLKALLKQTPLYPLYLRLKPKPAFDPFDYAFKQSVLLDYARRFGCKTLIETGTCEGGTVDALAGEFDRIVSIELDSLLAKRAQEKFAALPHITILQGDSGMLLPGLLAALDSPALFWLDAHYSGSYDNGQEIIHTAKGETDTPLAQEVGTILSHYRFAHVILIDDARELGKGDYPSLAELRKKVRTSRVSMDFRVEKDILRIVPASRL